MVLQEQKILQTIKEYAEKLPKFSDGRINYSKSDTAPVLTIFIKYKDKILLLKRSNKVSLYQRKWNTVAGYLDEIRPIHEKILEEIREEIGVEEENILSYNYGEPYNYTDTEVNKTWIVHPVLVKLKHKPNIKLDWEHTEFKWIKPQEIRNFDIVVKVDESLRRVLS